MGTKRYRLPDGSVNEDMFDYNILVHLNRLTRTGTWASHYEVARAIYQRPNARTFDNVRAALLRQPKDVKRCKNSDMHFQIRRRK